MTFKRLYNLNRGPVTEREINKSETEVGRLYLEDRMTKGKLYWVSSGFCGEVGLTILDKSLDREVET